MLLLDYFAKTLIHSSIQGLLIHKMSRERRTRSTVRNFINFERFVHQIKMEMLNDHLRNSIDWKHKMITKIDWVVGISFLTLILKCQMTKLF